MEFDFTDVGGDYDLSTKVGISTPILIFLVCMALLIILLVLSAVIYVIRPKNSYQNAPVTRTAIVQIPQQQGVAPAPAYAHGMWFQIPSSHVVASLDMQDSLS